jgi:peroxiredoxin
MSKSEKRVAPARSQGAARPGPSEETTTGASRPGSSRWTRARSQTRGPGGFRLRMGWVYGGATVLIVGAIVALVVYSAATQGGPQGGQTSQYPYQVGSPGPGSNAPEIKLTATDGSQFDLAGWRGKTVLLYFEEGVGCQPCWDQLKDVNANFSQFQSLGVQQVVTITGDPMDALTQKVALEGIKTPVLSDPGLAVSRTYNANQYGMMGTSADGHTFIVVGSDGVIKWRADYGGSPKYTMYLPVGSLVSDMEQGLKPKG